MDVTENTPGRTKIQKGIGNQRHRRPLAKQKSPRAKQKKVQRMCGGDRKKKKVAAELPSEEGEKGT